MHAYQDLLAWQKAMEVATQVHHLTGIFPKDNRYELTAQMHRAAISIPSNIAEGYRRRSRQEWAQYVHIAFGSAAELETQLILAKNLKLAPESEFRVLEETLSLTLRLLNGLCKSLRVRQ